MPKVLKATIGVRPLRKMFRVSSLHGVLTDALLSAQGTKPLYDDHFLEVGRGRADTALKLSNDDRGISLAIDSENVAYTHDYYAHGDKFDFDRFLLEFRAIWNIVSQQLSIKEVRRIGYVTEHRFPLPNASESLLKTITNIPPFGFVDKFHLSFESRKPTTKGGGLPDLTKDDFINVIRAYYDSAIDAEHPKEGFFNANLDVQRYFAPASKGNIPDELQKLRFEHEKAASPFFEDLKKTGLIA